MIRRLPLAVPLLAWSAFAAPALTTIQDVLYKADGTRFSGTLTISWNSFQAADNSSIVMQSTTVKVLNGNLLVQLVPTTSTNPPVNYTVTYNSDGRVQFQETWAVPASATPLHVRDVRIVVTGASTSGGNTGADTGTLVESQITGLISDLGARPVKGPGYAAGRVALVNSSGAIESVIGNASDCVRVDGSSGPCGGTAPSFVDSDSPSGIVDGSNLVFNLAAQPSPANSLAVYRNGMLQKSGQDYNLSGTTIQFVAAAAPQPGDTLLASYRTSGNSSSSGGTVYSSPQILCSGVGASTNSTALASVGACTIPAGVLSPGDRVEIRFDYAHQGSAGGFSIEVHWGETTVVHRDAASTEAVAAGLADAGILAGSAQLSSQTWGGSLPFIVNAGMASDSYASGLVIDFRGLVAQAADSLALSNFTVVRIP
jgi:hypothetical protein